MPISSLSERAQKISTTEPPAQPETLPQEESALSRRVNKLTPEATQAQTNLNVTKDLDPDNEAKIHDLSKKSGYPANVVRNAQKETEEALNKPVYTIDDPQYLNKYFSRSTGHATISRDDIPELEKTQATLGQKLKRSYRAGVQNVEIGELRYMQLTNEGDFDEIERRIQTIKTGQEPAKTLKELREEKDVGFVEKALLGAAEQAPILLSTTLKALERGFTGAAAGATIATIAGQLGPQILTPEEVITVPTAAAAGFGIGTTAGAAEQIFKLESGLAADEFMEFRDENDQPLEPEIVWAASVAVGAVNSGLEFISLKALLRTIPGAEKFLGRITTQQVMNALKNPTTRQALKKVATKHAGAVGVEALTEFSQESVTILAGEIAKTTSDKEFEAVTFEEGVERSIEAGKAAIGPTIIFGTPGSIVGTVQAVNNYHSSADAKTNLDKDQKVVNETKTLERSRDHAKEFVESLPEGQDDVYISSEGIRFLQDERPEIFEETLKKVGVDPEEARANITTGTDTTVKRSEVLTLNSEEYSAISNDIKAAPGAYTAREITEQKANEDIENTVNIVKEAETKERAINQEVTRISEEGKKAGLSEELAEKVPVLTKGIANKLELEGIDPVEFLKKIGIRKEQFKFAKDIIEFLQPTKEGPPRGPRGAVPITNENHTISLFENADLSTVLHEVGHIALKEYTTLETTGQASTELKADMAVIRQWVGAEAGAELNREQSEQFARGFEAYLMEGKAPTAELRSAFERFKAWLTETYKSVKALNVKLTPQVRQVFDRMLSVNIEVETAAQAGGFVAKTTEEMDALGMIEADQIFAKGLIQQTVNKATEALAKDRNRGYRENVKTWREEAGTEVRAEDPNYDIIKNIIDTGNQIDRADLVERYGEKAVKSFPHQRIIAKPISRKESLRNIRGDVAQGEAGRRLVKRDKEGNVIGVTVVGGTFPEYFKGKGYTKKGALSAIDKAIAGKKLTEQQKIMVNDLVEGYRDEIGRRGAEGENLDSVAAQYDFDSGDDMILSLSRTPQFKEAVDRRVALKTAEHDAQFKVEDYIVDLKEYRDYLDIMARYITGQEVDPQVIEAGIQKNTSRWLKEARNEIESELPLGSPEEIKTAITTRLQEKITAFRERKAKPKAISTDALKSLAREVMAAKTVREARAVHKYLAAMKKATSDERRAIMSQDWGAASTANELGRFNYEMASLSKNIRDEVDTIQKRAKRIGKPKKTETIDFKHKEAILHLINRFNLASLAPKNPQETPAYNALFAGDEYGNDGFPASDFLLNDSRDFRDLSLEQLREVDDAIRYLEGQGRIERQAFLSDNETLLQDVVNESLEVQKTVKRRKVWEKGSMMRRVSGVSRRLFARLDSLTFTAKKLDGYTNLGKDGIKGPVERFIVDKIKEANNNMLVDGEKVKALVEPHLNQLSKTIRKWHKKFGNNIQIEGAPLPQALINDGQTKGWHAQQIFAIVLNTGNTGDRSNLQNLMAGYPDLTFPMIENIKNMLSQKDMDAVQGIWDAINSLFPAVNETHLRIKNYPMPKVEATPFVFKGKRYRGGYYPIRHDRNLDFGVENRGKVADLFASDDAGFMTPYAKSGHTIKRLQGVALPIFLDLGVIDEHFRDSLRYVHFSEVIRDADRITRNPEFRSEAIRIIGREEYDTIRPALKNLANPKREGMDRPGARTIEWMRGLSTAYILAWNTGVAIKQPLSTFSAIRVMGMRAYLNGFSSTLMSPSTHYQRMTELSPYMRDRLTSFDRELKSQFLKLNPTQKGIYFGDTKVTWRDVRNFGFWQIRLADTAAVLPIWNGAFESKLNADQSNLQEAINYADDVVRDTQPSAQALDLSSWQRDGGAIRLFSMFQTFTVGKYGQRQRLHYRAWRNGSISTLDYAWFNVMDAMLPLVAINLLQSILWGRDLEDDENLKDMMFEIIQSWVLMGVPFANQIARSITGYGNPIDSPVFRTANKAIDGVIKGTKGLGGFKNKKERERALWAIAHTFSILSGVPVSKVVSKAQRGAKQKEAAPLIKYLVPAPPKKSK